MRIVLIALSIVMLFAAACTVQNTPLPHNTTNNTLETEYSFTYKTYGGFVPMDRAVQVVTVDDKQIMLQFFASNGSVTSSTASEITGAQYDELVRIVEQYRLMDTATQYPADPQNMVIADIGTLEITITKGSESHTVKILREYDPELPQGLEYLSDALSDIAASLYDVSVNMQFDGVACEDTPWQAWYASGAIQFIREPTSEELIHAYYSSVHGVEVYGVEKHTIDGAVCLACGVCPSGEYFTLAVSSRQVSVLEEESWYVI